MMDYLEWDTLEQGMASRGTRGIKTCKQRISRKSKDIVALHIGCLVFIFVQGTVIAHLGMGYESYGSHTKSSFLTQTFFVYRLTEQVTEGKERHYEIHRILLWKFHFVGCAPRFSFSFFLIDLFFLQISLFFV